MLERWLEAAAKWSSPTEIDGDVLENPKSSRHRDVGEILRKCFTFRLLTKGGTQQLLSLSTNYIFAFILFYKQRNVTLNSNICILLRSAMVFFMPEMINDWSRAWKAVTLNVVWWPCDTSVAIIRHLWGCICPVWRAEGSWDHITSHHPSRDKSVMGDAEETRALWSGRRGRR